MKNAYEEIIEDNDTTTPLFLKKEINGIPMIKTFIVV